MTSLVVTSALFRDMFGTRAMRQVFSDDALIRRYLEVEAALARAQATVGVIPQEAADAIGTAADPDRLHRDQLREKTELVGYPIVAVVEQLSALVGEHGRWVHYGATTQDIMDSTTVLQIREGLDLIAADLNATRDALADLARTHADTPMPGRTHLQHALPISFGQKCAVWLSILDRHAHRLWETRTRVEVGAFSGAAGTLASLGEDGLAVRDAFFAELGLAAPSMTWHTARDALAETTGFLALLAGGLGKIALDVSLMTQTEVGEAFEPFQPGRGASSTMPQKRNPISCELILAAAKITRQQHGTMLDALVQDHERATGPWHAEWHALPECFVVTAGALHHARTLLSGLEVDPARMRSNLDLTGGMIVAEAVMMALAPVIGREEAHHRVYKCCRRSLAEGISFLDALQEDPVIAPATTLNELTRLTDPANYMGMGPALVKRFLAERGDG
jgi:3-carboxy-cis,cis-muconate cycloisomerase